jgi:hypothetical protein
MNINQLEKEMLELFPNDEVVDMPLTEDNILATILLWNPKGSESPEGVGIAHPA